MIVKLKCVDNCWCDRFTKGVEYYVISPHGGNCHWVMDDYGEEALVSTDNPSIDCMGSCNNCNGKWEIVN